MALGRRYVQDHVVQRELRNPGGIAAAYDALQATPDGLAVDSLAGFWEEKEAIEFRYCREEPFYPSNLDGSLESGPVGIQAGDRLELSLMEPTHGQRFVVQAIYEASKQRLRQSPAGELPVRGHVLNIQLPQFRGNGVPVVQDGRMVYEEVKGTLGTRTTSRRKSNFVVNSDVTITDKVLAKTPGLRSHTDRGQAAVSKIQHEEGHRGKFTVTELDYISLRPGTEVIVMPEVEVDVAVGTGEDGQPVTRKFLVPDTRNARPTGAWVTDFVIRRHPPGTATGTFVEGRGTTQTPYAAPVSGAIVVSSQEV